MENPRTTSYKGVKSATKLLLLPKFDVVKGFAFDYMHTILLGVTRTLTNKWLDSRNHKEPFYLGNKLKELDLEFLSVKVPFRTQRTTRSLTERKFWKANEWKTWLTVSPAVLKNYLDSKYYNHFMKLVEATYLLLQEIITNNEVNRAEDIMNQFVYSVSKIYGNSSCSFNIHILCHAAECVRNWGPVWCYSTFQFEHYNGVLMKYFNGTTQVPIQICRRICDLQEITKTSEQLFKNLTAKKFFYAILKSDKTASCSTVLDQFNFLGKKKTCQFQKQELDQFTKMFGAMPCEVYSYTKCLINQKLYSVDTSKSKSRCNSIVSSDEGKFFLLKDLNIAKCAANAFIPVARAAKICVKKNRQIYSVSKIETRTIVLNLSRITFVRYFILSNSSTINFIVPAPNWVEIE